MSEQHPIEGMVDTVMSNLKDMVDVNIILGDPVESPDGTVILPISRVGYGFAVGGSEFKPNSGSQDSGSQDGSTDSKDQEYPFGGGAGGGISISPIGFLVVSSKGTQMIHIDKNAHLAEKLIDLAPQAVDKIQEMLGKAQKDRDKEKKDQDMDKEKKDQQE
ncbi:GerW family sporulation protein [Aquibacillus albus]|uniref:Sporulation protein YtfJ n=1 Tax=Aquibacillus albus TaxID=1168171 RepID=A0ABS2N3Z0_9BACI|nr:GerW family sporulation protein [Aquibacillus albus]MBM7572860.1 sporulation protein YtfJ [Aquibacillus albus]